MFSPEILIAFYMSPFQCYRRLQNTGFHAIPQSVRVLLMSSKLNLGKFILRVHEKVFHLLGWSGLQKITSKLPSFNNCGAHFPVGKIIYWVCNFGQWAG